jgi:hypothetical protein
MLFYTSNAIEAIAHKYETAGKFAQSAYTELWIREVNYRHRMKAG